MVYITDINKTGKQEKDLFSYEFEHNRIIRMTGEINDQMADEVKAKLNYLDYKNHDDIIIYINSPGGSITAGLSILDSMKSCHSDIKTICTGLAASMGAFLVTCGGSPQKRFIEPNAEMMIHQPLGGTYGQASQIEITAKRICKAKKKLNRLLAESTGQPFDKIALDTDRDYFLDADEAVEYGLVDAIL